jgi:hypothetical protein
MEGEGGRGRVKVKNTSLAGVKAAVSAHDRMVRFKIKIHNQGEVGGGGYARHDRKYRSK